MTPEQFDAHDDRLVAMDAEIERLRERVNDTERRYSQSLVANTKLTAELGATLVRADQEVLAARRGRAMDFVVVGAGLLLGWGVGYYGQKLSRKFPILVIGGFGLATFGAAMHTWSLKYRGACIFGGVGMAAASIYVFAVQGTPPYATQ